MYLSFIADNSKNVFYSIKKTFFDTILFITLISYKH